MQQNSERDATNLFTRNSSDGSIEVVNRHTDKMENLPRTADGTLQPTQKEDEHLTNTDIEKLHYDDDIILPTCTSNSILCDSVSAIVEILSFEGDDAREEMPTLSDQMSQRSPSNRRRSESSAVSNKPCLSPSNDCQRRGRFLVWPAALQARSLSLAEEA